MGVCLATAGYSLRKQLNEGRSADGRIIAIIALAGMFCFFTVGMTLTSGKYIFENITNIDVLRSSAVVNVAVRIPPHCSPSPKFPTITYPLPLRGSEEEFAQNNGFAGVSRDKGATNSFAVLRTEPGENPFDLGPWKNFKAVMGNNIFEWLLPIKPSPCCDHDSMMSDYEFGPLIGKLMERHNVPGGRINDSFGHRAAGT